MRNQVLAVIGLLGLLVGAVACRSGPPPPSADALVSQASALDLAGDPAKAIDLYREALARDPRSYKAQYGIGRALDLTDRYDEAREHFSAAVALAADSDKDQATRMLGIAWTFAGRADEAARQFQIVFDRRLADGSFGGAADVASELGRVYLELGDLDQAETWYRRGRDTALREADLPAWRVDLAELRWAHAEGRLAARRGHADLAHRRADAVQALLTKGGNDDQRIQYPYLLGYIAFYLGDFRTAAAELERADQKDPFILLLRGDALEGKLGDHAAARSAYQQVLASSSHAVSNAVARPAALARLR